jgi:hypothetical protein
MSYAIIWAKGVEIMKQKKSMTEKRESVKKFFTVVKAIVGILGGIALLISVFNLLDGIIIGDLLSLFIGGSALGATFGVEAIVLGIMKLFDKENTEDKKVIINNIRQGGEYTREFAKQAKKTMDNVRARRQYNSGQEPYTYEANASKQLIKKK